MDVGGDRMRAAGAAGSDSEGTGAALSPRPVVAASEVRVLIEERATPCATPTTTREAFGLR